MTRHRIHVAGQSAPETDIGRRILDEIRRLEVLSVSDLKKRWRELSGSEPPPFAKRSLLTQHAAWEMQAKAFGGLRPALHRQLIELGSQRKISASESVNAVAADLRPGVRLLRVWRGETQQVIVTEDGFLWRGKPFRSLSTIAREITGTQWSGPVFFGLKKSKQKEVGPIPDAVKTSLITFHG